MGLFELVIAGYNLLMTLIILYFIARIIGEVRGSKLFYTAIFFLFSSIVFVYHALIEIMGWGNHYYAATGLLISLFLAGAIYFANESTKALGV